MCGLCHIQSRRGYLHLQFVPEFRFQRGCDKRKTEAKMYNYASIITSVRNKKVYKIKYEYKIKCTCSVFKVNENENIFPQMLFKY